MEIFIHLGTNLEYFDLLNKGKLLSMWKQDRELASFFMENFPGELATTISPQYEVNFMWIREIKKRFWVEAFNKIWGIYYGSDNCEYLAPTKIEIEKAIEVRLGHKINFNDKEELALDILAVLEDAGLSLIGNGWLDDEPEEIITKIEERF